MRIGYVCKYVPVEALEAMGAHMERIEPDESLVSFDAAESCMHANVCSFAKATFETVLSRNLDGIVLTTCCDSMRRLADALRAQAPNLFIHVLDVPARHGRGSLRAVPATRGRTPFRIRQVCQCNVFGKEAVRPARRHPLP